MDYKKWVEAAKSNDIAGLQGDSPNSKFLQRLLFIAVQNDSVEFVKKLVNLDPGLAFSRKRYNRTAMHIGCERGNVEMVRVLAGVDPDLHSYRDANNRTPLHIAAEMGWTGVVQVLLEACPESAGGLNSFRQTPLHLAVKKGKHDCFRSLMDHCLENDLMTVLNHQDEEGNTVLHIATSQKEIQILKMLLKDCLTHKEGAALQVNATNVQKLTPLDIHFSATKLSAENDKCISVLLRNAGAKVGDASHVLEEILIRKIPPTAGQEDSSPSNVFKMLFGPISSTAAAVHVAVWILFAGLSAIPIVTFQTFFPEEFVKNHKVEVLLLLAACIFFFIATMVMISIEVWSMEESSYLLVNTVMQLCIIVAVVFVCAITKFVVPHSVTFGSHKISSFVFVMLLALGMLFLSSLLLCLLALWTPRRNQPKRRTG